MVTAFCILSEIAGSSGQVFDPQCFFVGFADAGLVDGFDDLDLEQHGLLGEQPFFNELVDVADQLPRGRGNRIFFRDH